MIKEENNILICKMYTGSYIDNNLGHEVINLFKADNNQNYIYINRNGRIPNYRLDKVKYIVLTTPCHRGEMKIIAVAEVEKGILEEEQIELINTIKYGKTSLLRVFNDEKQNKNNLWYFTYKIKNIYQLSQKATLLLKNNNNIEGNVIVLNINSFRQRTYISNKQLENFIVGQLQNQNNTETVNKSKILAKINNAASELERKLYEKFIEQIK